MQISFQFLISINPSVYVGRSIVIDMCYLVMRLYSGQITSMMSRPDNLCDVEGAVDFVVIVIVTCLREMWTLVDSWIVSHSKRDCGQLIRWLRDFFGIWRGKNKRPYTCTFVRDGTWTD